MSSSSSSPPAPPSPPKSSSSITPSIRRPPILLGTRTTSAPINWLQKLKAQFLAGVGCDVIIRVTLLSSSMSSLSLAIDLDAAAEAEKEALEEEADEETGGVKVKPYMAAPPDLIASRMNTDAITASTPKEEDSEQHGLGLSRGGGHTVDIPCHSLVLMERSDYFDRALRGGWAETGTKIINITRDDEASLGYFKLLLELSYMGSYIHKGDGVLFDRMTRWGLATVANEFEFDACIRECVFSLGLGLSLEQEVVCLADEVPVALQMREVVLHWRKQVMQDIANGGLGPLQNFYEQGSFSKIDAGMGFYTLLTLKPHIKALSLEAMLVVFRSLASGLRCREKEAEVYYVLGAWLYQSPHVKVMERVIFYKSLVAQIPFQYLSPGFMGCVVGCCPLAIESGMALSFLRTNLIYRSVGDVTGQVKPDDAIPAAEWTFESRILLADVISLEKNEEQVKPLGVAGGFPVGLSVKRAVVVVNDKNEQIGADTFGVYVHVWMPPTYDSDVAFYRCLKREVGFSFDVQVGSVKKSMGCCLFDGVSGCGFSDFFLGANWKEVVGEKSRKYFPLSGGEVKVTVAMKKETM